MGDCVLAYQCGQASFQLLYPPKPAGDTKLVVSPAPLIAGLLSLRLAARNHSLGVLDLGHRRSTNASCVKPLCLHVFMCADALCAVLGLRPSHHLRSGAFSGRAGPAVQRWRWPALAVIFFACQHLSWHMLLHCTIHRTAPVGTL